MEFLKPEKQAGGMTAAARLRMRPPAAGFGNQKDMGGWVGGGCTQSNVLSRKTELPSVAVFPVFHILSLAVCRRQWV